MIEPCSCASIVSADDTSALGTNEIAHASVETVEHGALRDEEAIKKGDSVPLDTLPVGHFPLGIVDGVHRREILWRSRVILSLSVGEILVIHDRMCMRATSVCHSKSTKYSCPIDRVSFRQKGGVSRGIKATHVLVLVLFISFLRPASRGVVRRFKVGEIKITPYRCPRCPVDLPTAPHPR
jgi:hypothetical protein